MVSKWRTIHISARWSSLPYSSAYQSFLGRTKYPSVGLAGASNNLDRDCMFGDNFAKELQSIPLSNDTVSRQIDDIAEDVEQQLFAARGLLTTDHVILNHGQVTWMTPELAPLSPNYHTTNGKKFQLSTDLTCIAAYTIIEFVCATGYDWAATQKCSVGHMRPTGLSLSIAALNVNPTPVLSPIFCFNGFESDMRGCTPAHVEVGPFPKDFAGEVLGLSSPGVQRVNGVWKIESVPQDEQHGVIDGRRTDGAGQVDCGANYGVYFWIFCEQKIIPELKFYYLYIILKLNKQWKRIALSHPQVRSSDHGLDKVDLAFHPFSGSINEYLAWTDPQTGASTHTPQHTKVAKIEMDTIGLGSPWAVVLYY
ncbi:hypothetical protein TNCV_595232 [Trichonephila clavipes]|nr:hypothetical protein TNCV_595232 [Trichonephila clavipes]